MGDCEVEPGEVQLYFQPDGSLGALYQLSNQSQPVPRVDRYDYFYQLHYAQIAASARAASESQMLSDNPVGFSTQLTGDAEGRTVASWLDYSSGEVMAANKTGSQFGSGKPLSKPGETLSFPKLQADPQGRILASWLWADSRNLIGGVSSNLEYKAVPGESEAFSSPSLLSELDSAQVSETGLDKTPEGEMVASWSGEAGGGHYLNYRLIGAPPEQPGPVQTVQLKKAFRPIQVKASGRGKLTIFWIEVAKTKKGFENYNLKAGEVELGNPAIKNQQRLSRSGLLPTMASSPDGTVVATWEDSTSLKTSAIMAAVKPAGAARFSKPITVSKRLPYFKDMSSRTGEARLAVGPGGKTLITWNQGGASKADVYAAVKPAGKIKFSKPQKLASFTRPLWYDDAGSYYIQRETPVPMVGPSGQLAVAYRTNQGKLAVNSTYQFKVKIGR